MAGTEVGSADAHGAPRVENVRACGVGRLVAISGLISGIWLIAASRWIVTDTVVPWDAKNQAAVHRWYGRTFGV